jgi:Transposase
MREPRKTLGVHPTQLRDWVKNFADDPQQAFPGPGQMKPEQLEIARLKREVAKLKAERDIVRKPRPTSRRNRREVRLHREAPAGLAGGWLCEASGSRRARRLAEARTPRIADIDCGINARDPARDEISDCLVIADPRDIVLVLAYILRNSRRSPRWTQIGRHGIILIREPFEHTYASTLDTICRPTHPAPRLMLYVSDDEWDSQPLFRN